MKTEEAVKALKGGSTLKVHLYEDTYHLMYMRDGVIVTRDEVGDEYICGHPVNFMELANEAEQKGQGRLAL